MDGWIEGLLRAKHSERGGLEARWRYPGVEDELRCASFRRRRGRGFGSFFDDLAQKLKWKTAHACRHAVGGVRGGGGAA